MRQAVAFAAQSFAIPRVRFAHWQCTHFSKSPRQ
ncbi:hypothetical protein AZ54_19370 [Xanthomonas oryzae pv. oryzae PXO86]|nr:hypothetical protein AZ54_19370 [Xanthomonas oryzae pv. oryzae PXO86]